MAIYECILHSAGVGDLERLLARLNAYSGVGYGRDAENVVLYEDAGKQKLLALHRALCALQALKVNCSTAPLCFASLGGIFDMPF